MRPYAVRGWRNGEKRGRRAWRAVGSMVYKRDEAGGVVRGSTVKRKFGLSRIMFGLFKTQLKPQRRKNRSRAKPNTASKEVSVQ